MFIICCLLFRVMAGMAFSFQATAGLEVKCDEISDFPAAPGYSLLPQLFGPSVSAAAGTLEGECTVMISGKSQSTIQQFLTHLLKMHIHCTLYQIIQDDDP